jgi:Flp pilus assembly protein CpaB
VSAIVIVLVIIGAFVVFSWIVKSFWHALMSAIPTQREAMRREAEIPVLNRREKRRIVIEHTSLDRGGPLHIDHARWMSMGGTEFNWMVYSQTTDLARLAYLNKRPEFSLKIFPEGLPELPRQRVR